MLPMNCLNKKFHGFQIRFWIKSYQISLWFVNAKQCDIIVRSSYNCEKRKIQTSISEYISFLSKMTLYLAQKISLGWSPQMSLKMLTSCFSGTMLFSYDSQTNTPVKIEYLTTVQDLDI